jgi:hypothetical protein
VIGSPLIDPNRRGWSADYGQTQDGARTNLMSVWRRHPQCADRRLDAAVNGHRNGKAQRYYGLGLRGVKIGGN